MTIIDRRSRLFFIVLLAVFLNGLAARLLPHTEEIRLGLLVWQQLLFVIGGIFGAGRDSFGPLNSRTLVYGLFTGLALYMVNLVTSALSQGLATILFGNEFVQNLLLRENLGTEFLLKSDKPLIFFGMVLLLTIGAPLGEELFFRGLLLDLWNERYGTKKAIFFSALVFALLHFYLLQFIPVLLSGILLGVLFVRSENIVVPIIAHSTVNSLVLVSWLLSL